MIVAGIGHRPERLPGRYERASPERVELFQRIREVVRIVGVTRGRTGLALGADQDFALACIELGIPFDAIIPFEGFDSLWDLEHRALASWLQGHPLATVTVLQPGPYARWKLAARNQEVISPAEAVIAVFDGVDGGGTADALRACVAGHKRIWHLDPTVEGQLGGWLNV